MIGRLSRAPRGISAGLAAGGALGPLMIAASSYTSPLIGGAVLIGILVTGAILLFPFYGFLVTVLMVPLERVGRLTNDIEANTFSVMRIMGVLNLASLLLHALLNRRKFRFSVPLAVYGIYLFIGLLTLAHTSDMNRGVSAAGAMVGNLLFLFLTTNIVESERQARIAAGIWLLITVGVGLFTIYQWHNPASRLSEDRYNSTGARTTDERFSTVLEDASEVDLSDRMPRASGTSSHPTVYAINTILTLPFFAFFVKTGTSRIWKLAAAVGFLVACYNILLTNTRAALLTMGISMVLMFWTKLVVPKPAVIASLAIVGILMIPMVPAALWDRILNVDNYSAEKSATLNARLIYWRVSWDILRDHPILGIGIGNQSEVPKRVTTIALPPNSSVHNEYIESLLEVGLLGYPVLVAFMVILYRRCRAAERVYRNYHPETALLLAAARVAFITTLIYGVQVDVMHFPLKGWWLAMGLVVALSELSKKRMAGSMSKIQSL
jgi:O-antigen ligase